MLELTLFLKTLKAHAPIKKRHKKKYKKEAAKKGQYILMTALSMGEINLENLDFEDMYDGAHLDVRFRPLFSISLLGSLSSDSTS